MPKYRNDLTAERVRSLLDYNPETGVFTWKRRNVPWWDARYALNQAGRVRRDRYCTMAIDRRDYLAHRLAWLWMTGAWPPGSLDHADGDPSNNRWGNLRVATIAQNGQNARLHVDSRTSLKGAHVTTGDHTLPYRARIKINRREVHLGFFATPEEAHAAYVAAARQHFGEFARER